MASLVAVYQEPFGKPLDAVKLSQHLDHERQLKAFGHGPCHYLVRARVLDSGKVAAIIGSVIDVGDVSEEMPARRRRPELPVKLVGEYSVGLHHLRHLPERIGLPYRAHDARLPHDSPYLLQVHHDSLLMLERHLYLPCPFCPSLEVIGPSYKIP